MLSYFKSFVMLPSHSLEERSCILVSHTHCSGSLSLWSVQVPHREHQFCVSLDPESDPEHARHAAPLADGLALDKPAQRKLMVPLYRTTAGKQS